MPQFISRSLFIVLAALSMASCGMSTEVAPTKDMFATKQAPLMPTVSETAAGTCYTWEFNVAWSEAAFEGNVTDSLMMIVDQVNEIRRKG